MLNKIFPYILQLHIFQLDEYNPSKFISWIFKHFFIREIENKKKLIWTAKAKAIYYLAIFTSIIVILLLTKIYATIGFIIGLLIATQSYIALLLAYYLLLPLGNYRKNKIRTNTAQKINALKKLKIIGITGSYGKTSVKEFLYQILKTQHTVLKTPESYNTPYGIAKVVDLELDNSYEYFICEMGAYKIGEIKEICDMIHPRFGILTGINEQHLETFGSLTNTTKGKFELIDSLPKNGFGIVNIDNEYIKNKVPSYDKKLTSYGFSDNNFSIKDSSKTVNGTSFSLILDGKKYTAQTKLLGVPNLQNILAAATMSYLLGMKPHMIIQAIGEIKAIPHRLEIKRQHNMTIIDDAYNSNVDGFKEAIILLNSFKQPTVCITPGIVDLGDQTYEIHKSIGMLMDKIEYVILIGKSDRTRGLTDGIRNKKKIITLTSIKEVWTTIEKLTLENPVVLLENDLPDNY